MAAKGERDHREGRREAAGPQRRVRNVAVVVEDERDRRRQPLLVPRGVGDGEEDRRLDDDGEDGERRGEEAERGERRDLAQCAQPDERHERDRRGDARPDLRPLLLFIGEGGAGEALAASADALDEESAGQDEEDGGDAEERRLVEDVHDKAPRLAEGGVTHARVAWQAAAVKVGQLAMGRPLGSRVKTGDKRLGRVVGH